MLVPGSGGEAQLGHVPARGPAEVPAAVTSRSNSFQQRLMGREGKSSSHRVREQESRSPESRSAHTRLRPSAGASRPLSSCCPGRRAPGREMGGSGPDRPDVVSPTFPFRQGGKGMLPNPREKREEEKEGWEGKELSRGSLGTRPGPQPRPEHRLRSPDGAGSPACEPPEPPPQPPRRSPRVSAEGAWIWLSHGVPGYCFLLDVPFSFYLS